ncbi:MAG: hypothetical protein Q8P75_00400 [bacterium]|nr:hypothetical protein [bacterium]
MPSVYTNYPEKELLYPLLIFLIRKRLEAKGKKRSFSTPLSEFRPLLNHISGAGNFIAKIDLLKSELQGIADDLEELFIIKNPDILIDFANAFTNGQSIDLKYGREDLLKYYKKLKQGDGYRERKASLDDMLADLESNVPAKPSILRKGKKNIELPEWPAGLRWEEIAIRFFNGGEVMIDARDERKQTTFAMMGFENEKNKQPNVQWKLLQELAANNGEINWDTVNDLGGKNKKRKQLLSQALKYYFQIADDPFENYRKVKAYRIKINLIPEQGHDPEHPDRLGIRDFLDEQNPSVYEENQDDDS